MIAVCDIKLKVYDIIVYLSILFALRLSVYASTQAQGSFGDDPDKGWKVYCSCGLIKMTIGLVLGTVFYPEEDCIRFTFRCYTAARSH